MNSYETARFRATTGPQQAFGGMPQEAVTALMRQISTDAFTPITIWPYTQPETDNQDHGLKPEAQKSPVSRGHKSRQRIFFLRFPHYWGLGGPLLLSQHTKQGPMTDAFFRK